MCTKVWEAPFYVIRRLHVCVYGAGGGVFSVQKSPGIVDLSVFLEIL